METQNFLLKIVNNEDGLYHGNLRYYFKLMFNSPNSSYPYHNFRHMSYVTCTAYECAKSIGYPKIMGKISFRALLIAAMFHDYNHSLEMIDDKINIASAVSSIEKYILDEDINLLPQIIILISETEFPHVKHGFSLGGSILRDADLSQSLSDVWMQQVIFGLAAEMKITPSELLLMEVKYLQHLNFETTWAKDKFGPMIIAKIHEVNEFIKILL
ncbi:MAG TPA: HD domain-containing protein [Candidatus Paceibacterota bacterium]